MNVPPELPQDPLFAPASSRPVGRRHNIRVGTCSWTDPSLIKAKTFYPRGCSTAEKRLAFYASQFPVVEVDSSFFAMPQPQHAALWAERTPAGFQFNVKAFRLLTGHQTPPEVFPPDMKPWLPPLAARKKNYYYADLPPELQDELWRRFIAALAPLKAAGKLKAVHFQFAPWATSAPEWRAHVELCVERMAGHLLAVEFRNQSWLNEAQAERTLAWERELGVAHVVVDEPQGVGNFVRSVWALTNPQLAVVRLHGRNAETWNAKGLAASSERFNYEYRDEELQALAGQIESLAEEAFELQVLVNVNFEDQGIRAAQKLATLMRREV
ncbi:DUF72 domain-containing protein [Ideonella sp.]|uniref:DUF72 domain-containing protein n=1 Tax=Ideonella sp. TaxID=1929293 RepID=UPI002B49611E|nr:DUF72 domain-containing protein [Ideonella sp.]HJV71261.1 DUF72 domain-containing protein [Ideonella sp.]